MALKCGNAVFVQVNGHDVSGVISKLYGYFDKNDELVPRIVMIETDPATLQHNDPPILVVEPQHVRLK